MLKPFNWYVDQYNLVRKSRRVAAYRLTKDAWAALMQYRQYEIEDAVKAALKLPKLQLVKDSRFEPLLCTYHKENGWIGGAAMREWDCPGCKRHLLNGSTAIPAFCSSCAFDKFVCAYCGKSLEEDLAKSLKEAKLTKKSSNRWPEELLRLVQVCRAENSDLRFGQLLYNLIARDSEMDADFHARLFNIEDTELAQLLKNYAATGEL